MKVYRLERYGYGIFCSSNSKIELNVAEDALYSEFGFSCDQNYHWISDWRSACESIDKLIEYFGSDFAYALEEGANIVEYIVHKAHVKFGRTDTDECVEVIFNSTKAKSKQVILEGFEGEDDE